MNLMFLYPVHMLPEFWCLLQIVTFIILNNRNQSYKRDVLSRPIQYLLMR